jgi:hypothetical protein
MNLELCSLSKSKPFFLKLISGEMILLSNGLTENGSKSSKYLITISSFRNLPYTEYDENSVTNM